ncbi:Glycosyltransferase involved in cell wall bisynthesis [Salegentibacter holothuriorum]|uniref:Glycosyltransferase involved in cell wall bisynthesis n=2 Tax=Salegentibacter holothuriorum TaxID=241145 RepID=A0A1T5APF1_9FLAO|nr:Glycosyltransferase involved in cell wall bisynthesis [Salegentibacter holothuriorum]
MKILLLINSFGRGGAEKSTVSFILKVNKQYENINFVCVYLHPYKPGFYDEIEQNKIPLIHIKEKGFFSRVKRFKGIIEEFHPDIVHSVLFDSNLISRFSSIGRNEIFVESLVNKTYSKDREYQSRNIQIKSYLIKLIDKSSSYLVDYFHSVGFAVANHYLEVYNRKFNYTVVERGRLKPINIPEKKGNVSGKLTLLTLARQEYQKGLLYLLEAMLPFRNMVQLQIVGREGSATEELKEYVRRNNMENDVEFCGYFDDIVPLVNNADVYVSASLYEGLPGSVIEAMSLKKPLILSDIEEHREVAIENENVLFFQPKNSRELSEKIEIFLNDRKLLKKFGSRSMEIFNERFTEDSMIKGMAEFYLNIFEKEKTSKN